MGSGEPALRALSTEHLELLGLRPDQYPQASWGRLCPARFPEGLAQVACSGPRCKQEPRELLVLYPAEQGPQPSAMTPLSLQSSPFPLEFRLCSSPSSCPLLHPFPALLPWGGPASVHPEAHASAFGRRLSSLSSWSGGSGHPILSSWSQTFGAKVAAGGDRVGEGSDGMMEPNIDRWVLTGVPPEAKGCSLCSRPRPAPSGLSWGSWCCVEEGRRG